MIAFLLVACSTAVTGQVVDGLTGAPIAGVEVSVAGTNLKGTTDDAGHYELDGPAAGSQKLAFAKGGYVSPDPLELTLESRHHTEAATVTLFPEIAQDGQFYLRDGKRAPFAVLNRDRWMTRYVDPTIFYEGFPAEVVQAAPHLAAGTVVYSETRSPGPPIAWMLHPLIHVDSDHLWNRRGTRFIEAPERYTIDSTQAVPLPVTTLAPGWSSVTIPKPPPGSGPFMLSPIPKEAITNGFAGSYYLNGLAFIIDPPPAEVVEVDGRKLFKSVTGDYTSKDQPWQVAHEVMRAWCDANAEACGQAATDLKKDVAGQENCKGRLLLAKYVGTFWNETCGGTSMRATIALDEASGAFKVLDARFLDSTALSTEGPFVHIEHGFVDPNDSE